MWKPICVLVLGVGLLGGCASRASNVAAAYVSPISYEKWSCTQLAEEATRVSERASVLSGVQDKKRTDDSIKTAVAIVLFWPAAFMIKGDDAQTAELARLKGEFEAIEKSSIRKGCSHEFRTAERQPDRRRAR